MHERSCVCADIPTFDLATRVAVVMHRREHDRTTATGPLALAALTNSELFLHGVRDAPLDLRHLHHDERRVLLLYPSEHAQVLDAELLRDDPRPVTLVVPDGSWRQASRIPKRVPGLSEAEPVTLPVGAETAWGVRNETKPGGLATFEAIARALGILESPAVERRLASLFEKVVATTLATRGTAPDSSQVDPALEPLSILFRDEHLVAIAKPSGVAVHRGWARDGVPLLQRLRDQLGRFVFPVHRLDRGTSGVLLFALSSEVARDLQAQFEAGDVDKRYLALCRGNDPELRRVDRPLTKDPTGRSRGAKKYPAVTELRLLATFERYGLYEARPLTGRSHQIRRHLRHVAHPIIGDVEHGKGEHNRIFRQRFGFHRLALHCRAMTLEHPRTSERLTLRAPLPAELSALFRALDLPLTFD